MAEYQLLVASQRADDLRGRFGSLQRFMLVYATTTVLYSNRGGGCCTRLSSLIRVTHCVPRLLHTMSSLITPDSPTSDSAPSSPASVPSPNLASRPVRATRGRRLTDLHGEGDDDFWQQEFFTSAQDEEEEWEKEGEEEVDVVDSDFFESEDEDEAEEADEDERESRGTKRKAYVDPRGKKATTKAATAPRPRKASAATASASTQPSIASSASSASASLSALSAPSVALLAAVGATRKSSRAATISATSAAHAKQQKRLASLAATQRPKLIFPVLTQAQQLQQAQQTEIDNTASLQQLLRIEEEKRKITLRHRKTKQSTILFHSTSCHNTVSWSSPSDLPLAFREEAEEERLMHMWRRANKRCAVTGERARYVFREGNAGFKGVEEWRLMEEARRKGEAVVDKTEVERVKAETESRREERKESEKEREKDRKEDRRGKDRAASRRREDEERERPRRRRRADMWTGTSMIRRETRRSAKTKRKTSRTRARQPQRAAARSTARSVCEVQRMVRVRRRRRLWMRATRTCCWWRTASRLSRAVRRARDTASVRRVTRRRQRTRRARKIAELCHVINTLSVSTHSQGPTFGMYVSCPRPSGTHSRLSAACLLFRSSTTRSFCFTLALRQLRHVSIPP